MFDLEGGVDIGIGKDAVIDAVDVGQQFILEPFVDGARRRPLRIAKVIEQRRFVRADDADDVADILSQLGQGGTRGVGGFTGERHE